MLRKKPFDLTATGGVVEDAPYSRQPRGTVRYALNMRPVDPRNGLRRVSVRAGSRALGSSSVPGAGTDLGGRIQAMAHVLLPAAPTVSDVRGRTLALCAVAGGTVKKVAFTGAYPGITVTAATGPTLASTPPIVAAVPLRQKVYFADGVNVFQWTPDTNVVESFTSLGHTGYPQTARLGCAWRGRLVLAGVSSEPHNWFMSAVDDVSDWDYLPTPERETQAVAGNNSPAGQTPDLITTLVPLSDDRLLFGCDHSIYVMRGDPASGGRIDLLSDVAGMAWGVPWCKSPDGTLYFFGSTGGIYRMRPGGLPERISNGRIESRLRNYELATTLARPAWNDKEVGVNFFFCDTTGAGGNVHVFYDEATETFWLDQFSSASCDVSAPYVVDGDDAGDRALLMGGLDGVIRYFDPTSNYDENTERDWSIVFGPLTLGDAAHALLDEIELVASGVLNVDYQLRTGETPEAAYAATAAVTGTLFDGTDLPRHVLRDRLAGNALYLTFRKTTGSTEGFISFDRMTAWLRESGRPSQRLARG